ncbi:glutamyl aminopeptidase [Neosynchiropus ocellatus]
MAHGFQMDDPQKRYCIRGTHVVIICVAVVVCSLTVGLAVGLTRTSNSIQPTLAPTTEPSKPPPPDRGPCLPSTDASGDWKNFRLPDYVTPVHYDLLLEPDLIDDVYSGTVDVHLEITKPTRHLWLHIRETFVSGKPRLKKMGGSEDIPVNGCFEYKTHQYVVVEAAKTLDVTAPGEVYILSLDFQGSLTGSVVGFYRVVYTENGQTKKIAATDHEPTDARKSFPCFDEPNKKATYNISIIHDAAYSSLSNMPVQGSPESLPENKKKTNFQKSVPMSTYLVCFAVHQFSYVERVSRTNIPLRIYAQPSQIATAEYAANTTKVIFDYFEEYFDMKYSLPKLDKIAIPDFGTGAMENWGLITYRETNLLYDEEQSSSTNKKQVAKVIAHELVHQWFGNIVTMDWWDDLWLNEGFASFFEYIGVEKAEPEWGMRDIMLTDDVLPVMVDDALLSSHPIIVNVSTPAEITSVFDAISYSKGASILRMLEDWMGKTSFRDGCRKYLKDYTFKNAKTANFWASLTNVSGFPVAEVMDTWTKQMGYPVLHLSVNETTASLTQKRFLLDPKANPNETPSPFRYKWTIPVKSYPIQRKEIILSMFMWTSSEHVVESYSPSADGLLKVNDDHIGFYRVNHDDSMWEAISEQLQSNLSVFDAADRASYVDDVFALSRANLIDYGNAFNLTKYLTAERDYIVWERVDASIAYVRDMLSGQEDVFPKFQKLFRNHVKAVTEQLGFTDDGTHTQRILRETVLDIACQMEDPDALREMSKMFDQWIDGTMADIPVNLRLLAYRYGMKASGNTEKWEIMFQRYKETSLAQEKVKLLYGLASVQNVDLLYKLLEATKNESVVRSQDLFTVVRYVSYNQMGLEMAWDWTTLNWDYLVQRYTINDRNLGRLLTQISSNYNTVLQKWKMENFFALTPDSGAGELARKQGLETVNNNIDWISNNRDEIKRWLDSNVV